MKRELIVVIAMVVLGGIASADSAQYGRIAQIKKSYSSYTKSYVNSTPVIGDITTYTISVQVGDSLIVGSYDLSARQPEPPPDWTKGYAVRVQEERDSMILRSGTARLQLHIKRRKAGKSMDPLTAVEKKRLDELDLPLQSLIGLSPASSSKSGGTVEASQAAREPVPQASPPPATPTGNVTVRSTPYLSEVFVDGQSMGYTPAKIALPPGKHIFRIAKSGYKPWTKEMTITVGSELTLDETLERK
jgi:hypothetical protein